MSEEKKVLLWLSREWAVYQNGKQVGTERDATLVGNTGQVAHFEGRGAEQEARAYAEKQGYELVTIEEWRELLRARNRSRS